MKKYIWESNKSIETFFREFDANTYKFSWNTSHWDEECFFARHKSNHKFKIIYHAPYVRNSFTRILYGKAESTPTGTKVTASVHMHPFVMGFSLLWYLGLLQALLVVIFSGSWIGLVFIFIFLCVGTLPFVFKGHPEKIFALMDCLCRE